MEKIAERLKVLLMQGCSAKGIVIIKGKVMPGHMHLLVSIPTSLSMAQGMQYLKGRSSKNYKKNFQN